MRLQTAACHNHNLANNTDIINSDHQVKEILIFSNSIT